MCDKDSEQDIQRWLRQTTAVNRRSFNKLLVAGAVVATVPAAAETRYPAMEVAITTSDGVVDALLVTPQAGKGPAVVVWPDIMGRRPAFDDMGHRLAAAGYTALVVNPFYRDISGAALPANVSFPSDQAWALLQPMRKKLTAEAVVRDAQAFFTFLDQHPSVAVDKQAAVMGFCMSGAFTLWAAAALPLRIGAIASFHGGGLATTAPDSPHLSIAQSRAQAMHAIAQNDHERAPAMKGLLEQAYQAANLAAEIEVYADALHGWMPTDSRVHHPQQAARAWEQWLALLQRAL